MGKGFKKLMAMAAVSAMTLTTLAGCGSDDGGKSNGGGDTLKWGVNYEQSGTCLLYTSILHIRIKSVQEMQKVILNGVMNYKLQL